jgi:hypothetical protein
MRTDVQPTNETVANETEGELKSASPPTMSTNKDIDGFSRCHGFCGTASRQCTRAISRIWPRQRSPGSRAEGKRTGFHFARKRFMVPLDFAIGKLGYSINIKGLAETLSLWRAV